MKKSILTLLVSLFMMTFFCSCDDLLTPEDYSNVEMSFETALEGFDLGGELKHCRRYGDTVNMELLLCNYADYTLRLLVYPYYPGRSTVVSDDAGNTYPAKSISVYFGGEEHGFGDDASADLLPNQNMRFNIRIAGVPRDVESISCSFACDTKNVTTGSRYEIGTFNILNVPIY